MIEPLGGELGARSLQDDLEQDVAHPSRTLSAAVHLLPEHVHLEVTPAPDARLDSSPQRQTGVRYARGRASFGCAEARAKACASCWRAR